MHFRPVGNEGTQLSRVSLGTVQFGQDYGLSKKKSQHEVDHILQVCLSQGINFLDTAHDYGDSETKIGNFIKAHSKNDFHIATKISHIPKPLFRHKQKLHDHIQKSLETSLNRLNRESVFLLYLHNIEEDLLLSAVFWEVLEDLKRSKTFLNFGISVYDTDLTKKVVTRYQKQIDIVQVPYSILDRRFSELFPFFKKNTIDIVSRSTFLRGHLFAPKKGDEDLASLAEQYQLSLSQLALLFVLNCPELASTLIGVNDSHQLHENLRVLTRMNMSQEIVNRLRDHTAPEILLRACTLSDSDVLLSWRNDPATRKNSIYTKKITREEHQKWLTASLKNPDRKILIAENKCRPMGTVRMDFKENQCELSWTVAPTYRGKGMGQKIVRLAVENLIKDRTFSIMARIRESNRPSVRIVENIGFNFLKKEDALLTYHLTPETFKTSLKVSHT